jgi:Dam-replacing family
MATARQVLGTFGEERVVRDCSCPRCKRSKTLVCLPPNFKCADVICDFCGYLAQVKTSSSREIATIPRVLLGAAWGPQKERMDAAIYFPLFLVLVDPEKNYAIHYLSADVQNTTMFRPRSPLSQTARRAGWQGFTYDLERVRGSFVRLK